MSQDALTNVLNSVQALVESGMATYAQVARDINEPPRSVYQWFGSRRFRPGGASAIKLLNWAADQTTSLSRLGETTKEGRAIHGRYRAEYKKVCAEFPADGRKS